MILKLNWHPLEGLDYHLSVAMIMQVASSRYSVGVWANGLPVHPGMIFPRWNRMELFNMSDDHNDSDHPQGQNMALKSNCILLCSAL